MYILLHIFPRVVIYLGWLLPNTSSGSPKTEREKDQPLSLRPCSPPGFTEPTPLDVAGALLPHLCTLTLFSYQLPVISEQFLITVYCLLFTD